jgi:hypothetical protein
MNTVRPLCGLGEQVNIHIDTNKSCSCCLQQLKSTRGPSIQAVLPTLTRFQATQRAMRGTLLALYNCNSTQLGQLAA